MMGGALRTNSILAIDLPDHVWKQLLDPHYRLSLTDMRQVDASLLDAILDPILKMKTQADFAQSGFAAPSESEEEGEGQLCYPLRLSDNSPVHWLPGPGRGLQLPRRGSARTLTEARRYCRLLTAARAQEGEWQVGAMRMGLCRVLPASVMRLLGWRRVRDRVCGSKHVDVAQLRSHTEYGVGVSPDMPHVQWFWQALESFSPALRTQFVRFVYACDRLPVSDADWAGDSAKRRPKIRMLLKRSRQRDLDKQDVTFPHAETCFFNLELPAYSSAAVLRQRLIQAIGTDWGMGGDEALLRQHGPLPPLHFPAPARAPPPPRPATGTPRLGSRRLSGLPEQLAQVLSGVGGGGSEGGSGLGRPSSRGRDGLGMEIEMAEWPLGSRAAAQIRRDANRSRRASMQRLDDNVLRLDDHAQGLDYNDLFDDIE